jgi:hypothetical protein
MPQCCGLDFFVVLPDCHKLPYSDAVVNELWAAILPTEEKRLRLDENKTLG